ncbi:hypothetical protein MPTK1_3g08830 [Marchantia polymorpha subsp. ruderalis]|uniref:Uncharacterized protein n=2 Tax=Marchantia polymorpha TaxID=3197 RepID=A0AAF6AYU0_MARPO|nr:hypothetical protein MARPO_0105s0034 [Marchantia polymorpha]BBN04924.1 hypothetical protein Mp_3g08830 [Marchantia polymorpha subsp. ruderalis]|eukprot:PTQ31920.1 hypothetical protein MARPO_0105s0034 [Marchantia polymorpha]
MNIGAPPFARQRIYCLQPGPATGRPRPCFTLGPIDLEHILQDAQGVHNPESSMALGKLHAIFARRVFQFIFACFMHKGFDLGPDDRI